MKVTIIIDEEDSGYTPLDPLENGELRTQISAVTAIIAGQVLPILMEMAYGGQLVRTLRWPSETGGKIGYVLVDVSPPNLLTSGGEKQ